MKTQTAFLIGLAAASVTLSACGGNNNVRKQLGLEKQAPDAFSVVTRAPLEVPPDYTLRPPTPGAQRPMELQPAEQARQTVFGKSSEELIQARSIQADSKGARALLEKAGAAEADPNIREVLVAEDTVLNRDERATAERLMFWRDGDALPQGDALDPVEELDRLNDGQNDTITKRNEELPQP